MRVLVTPPAVEPVSLAEAKVHCRVEHTDHDAQITALIVAARQHFETQTNRALVTQTWRADYDAFPCDGAPLRLSPGPVASIVTVAYVDGDGVGQVLAAEDRIDDVGGDLGRVAPLQGEPWPWIPARLAGIGVTFTAGYGDAAAVPELAKTAIRMLVAHWYENPQAVVVGSAVQTVTVPMAAQLVIDSYQIPALA